MGLDDSDVKNIADPHLRLVQSKAQRTRVSNLFRHILRQQLKSLARCLLETIWIQTTEILNSASKLIRQEHRFFVISRLTFFIATLSLAQKEIGSKVEKVLDSPLVGQF